MTNAYFESLDKPSLLARFAGWLLEKDLQPTQLPRDSCNFDLQLRDPASPLPALVRVVNMATPDTAPLTGAVKDLATRVADLADRMSDRDDRLNVVISVEDGKVVDTSATFAGEEDSSSAMAADMGAAAVAAALDEPETAPVAAEAPETAAVEVVEAEAEVAVAAAEEPVETPVEEAAPEMVEPAPEAPAAAEPEPASDMVKIFTLMVQEMGKSREEASRVTGQALTMAEKVALAAILAGAQPQPEPTAEAGADAAADADAPVVEEVPEFPVFTPYTPEFKGPTRAQREFSRTQKEHRKQIDNLQRGRNTTAH